VAAEEGEKKDGKKNTEKGKRLQNTRVFAWGRGRGEGLDRGNADALKEPEEPKGGIELHKREKKKTSLPDSDERE